MVCFTPLILIVPLIISFLPQKILACLPQSSDSPRTVSAHNWFSINISCSPHPPLSVPDSLLVTHQLGVFTVFSHHHLPHSINCKAYHPREFKNNILTGFTSLQHSFPKRENSGKKCVGGRAIQAFPSLRGWSRCCCLVAVVRNTFPVCQSLIINPYNNHMW